MDKILQTLSEIETNYSPISDVFHAEMEARNKKAFDHINLLKVVKILITEVKNDFNNTLVGLNREIGEKQKELEVISKKTKELTDSFGIKNSSNGRLLADQAITIEENDKKIKKQELSIAALNGDIEILNNNIVLLHSSKQGEERELKKLKLEHTAFENENETLRLQNGSLANEIDVKNSGIRKRTEQIAKLDGEILDKKKQI